MTKKHAKCSNKPPEVRPQKFGDHMTGDHLFEKRKHGWEGGNTALNMIDVATHYRSTYPRPDKSAVEVLSALQHFVGPHLDPRVVYTDGAPELKTRPRMT